MKLDSVQPEPIYSLELGKQQFPLFPERLVNWALQNAEQEHTCICIKFLFPSRLECQHGFLLRIAKLVWNA